MKSMFLLVSFTLTVTSLPVSAQRVAHVALSAGLSPALEGSWSRGYTGSHVQAALELTPAERRIGLRVDGFVHSMTRTGYPGPSGDPGLSARTSIIGGTASAVLRLGPPSRAVTPYVLAGAGGYRTEYGSPSPEWHFGMAAGGGVRFRIRSFGIFAESRLHQIADGSTPRLIPLSLGLRF